MYLVHVFGPALGRNRGKAATKAKPVIVLRPDWLPHHYVMCDEIDFTGKTKIVHTPDAALPYTVGKAVCYLQTRRPPLIRCGNDQFFPAVEANLHLMKLYPYTEMEKQLK